MKAMKYFLPVLLITVLTSKQTKAQIDGNYWLSLGHELSLEETAAAYGMTGENAEQYIEVHARLYKMLYLTGYLDGRSVGEGTLLALSRNKSGSDYSRILKTEIDKLWEQRKNITQEQLLEGLDSFYSDYANRGIHVELAIDWVIERINGDSQSELNILLEDMRRQAK